MPKLTAKEIYEKEFSVSLKGYNQAEVDAYLDNIISDYQEFAKRIYNLESQLDVKNNEIQKNQFRSNEELTSQPTQNNNLDLLQRVANLEKAVFGKK